MDFATVVLASTLAEESHPGRVIGSILVQVLVVGAILYLVVWAVIKMIKKPSGPGPGAPPAYWQGQAPPPGQPWPPAPPYPSQAYPPPPYPPTPGPGAPH